MNNFKNLLLALAFTGSSTSAVAQFNESGINAGFFDSSEEKTINFSEFHLPPLSVLYENAKMTPKMLSLAKAQQIAEAEVAKQKRHIFSYVHGHASYSYGKTDMWSNGSTTYTPIFQQFQGHEQSYWNVGVNLSVPLEDILDLGASVRRKRLEVDQAQINRDIAFDELKLQIAALYVKITNSLVTLKTVSEGAAAYQGAGALNLEDFHNGNMEIQDYAGTKLHEASLVERYQSLQTEITTNILTLEILSHTPILTNTTTEIMIDGAKHKSPKQLAKENKAVEKKIKKEAEEEEKKLKELERKEAKAAKEDTKNKK